MDCVGSHYLLTIHQTRLIIVLWLVNCSKLATFSASNRRILTSDVYVLLRNVISDQRLVSHGLHTLFIIIKILLMEKLGLTVILLLRAQPVRIWTIFRVVIRLQSIWLRTTLAHTLRSLLNDLLRLCLTYRSWQSIFRF